MGSATTHALSTIAQEIDRLGPLDAAAALSLLTSVDVLAASKPLTVALATEDAAPQDRSILAERTLGSRADAPVASVLRVFGAQTWSEESDLVVALQETAIRSIGQTSPSSDALVGELDAFLAAISSNGELELTLASKLTPAAEKVALIDRLFGERLSEPAVRILHSLAEHPFGRRIRRAVIWARDAIAAQAGRRIAHVTVVRPLGDEQLERLRIGLQERFGRAIAINQIIDPQVVAGMRIQLGDEVIDDTAATRLHHLRLQLA